MNGFILDYTISLQLSIIFLFIFDFNQLVYNSRHVTRSITCNIKLWNAIPLLLVNIQLFSNYERNRNVKDAFLQNTIMFTVTQRKPSKIIAKQRDGKTMRQLI